MATRKPKKTRMFGGKRFKLRAAFRLKSDATKAVKFFRKKAKGNMARKVTFKGKWLVYTRG